MNDLSTSDAAAMEALVGQIADDYTQRLNRGERPDIEEYAGRYPELADLLREVLPALQLIRAPEVGADGEPAGPLGTLGDYRLLREVGRGGMGIVYEAEQLSLGRRVALKVLPFAATLDARQLQRFKNEAQAAALLHHTHIVPVYGIGCDRGVYHYAMQFIEGQTLAEVIADLRRVGAAWRLHCEGSPPTFSALTPPVAALSTERSAGGRDFFHSVARLGVQAATALGHAHQLGVVHRDVKPGNLLLDAAGQLWVTDFGLARCRTESGLTRTGDLIGTLRYMSPEQALGKPMPVDHRSDLYSLGATLYELLTLEPAYGGRDREELLRQIADTEPKAPRRINSAIPVELETVVLKAMAREPERRYATAEELADDLRRFLDDRPVLARRPSLAVRAAKFARHHRAATAAAAAMLLLAVAGLLVTTVLVWREQEQTKDALARAEAQHRRAEANFNRAQDGAIALLLRVEHQRWDALPGIQDLRADLFAEGVRFLQQFVDEASAEPAVRFESARACRRIASVYCVQHNVAQAMAQMDKAAGLLEDLAAAYPAEATYRKELAGTYNLMGLLNSSLKQPDKAREAFARTAEQYRLALPHDASADTLNAYAWLLADCPVAEVRDPAQAVALALRAVERAPTEGKIWNTLGIAYYRAGDWPEAITALEKSMALRGGGNAWDWFFLAMSSWRQGNEPAARAWHAKAMQELERTSPQPADLLRYRAEATALMGAMEQK